MLSRPDSDPADPQPSGGAPARMRMEHAQDVGTVRRRPSIVSLTLLAVLVAALGYLWWIGRGERASQTARNPAEMGVPVLAAPVRVESVPVYLDGVGIARALNTVTVRAQVDGKLASVNFKEGQDVAAGDVLAQIDPALYQAQLAQAQAKKAQDEALLANARIDLARYQKLAAANAGSRQQADTQAAQVAQLEAQIKADQAAIDNAQIMLGYTRIVAPISGRTGLRFVDAGNLVRASDASGLVVITQIKPIAVQFSLPQQDLAQVNAAFAQRTLPVELMASDGRTVADKGVLTGIDNQVDQATGTVKLKAEFANDAVRLWPGQFVNVRLEVDRLAEALLVPTSAVQRGPAGTFSYVIGNDMTATARPVRVVQQNDTEAVIGSGLAAGERVVTTGFNSLSDGAKVRIGSADGTPTPDLAPRRRDFKGGGGGGGGGGRGH